MSGIDAGLNHVLHFSDRLLLLFFLTIPTSCEVVIVSFSQLYLSLLVCNAVILGAEVPNDNLSVDTSSHQHIWIFRVEFDGSYFDWRL